MTKFVSLPVRENSQNESSLETLRLNHLTVSPENIVGCVQDTKKDAVLHVQHSVPLHDDVLPHGARLLPAPGLGREDLFRQSHGPLTRVEAKQIRLNVNFNKLGPPSDERFQKSFGDSNPNFKVKLSRDPKLLGDKVEKTDINPLKHFLFNQCIF
jgi:hypothetical protein